LLFWELLLQQKEDVERHRFAMTLVKTAAFKMSAIAHSIYRQLIYLLSDLCHP
jgi:hypothetical protein